MRGYLEAKETNSTDSVSRRSLAPSRFVVQVPLQRVLPSEALAAFRIRAWPVRLRNEMRPLVTKEVRKTLGMLDPGTVRTLPGIVGVLHSLE